jgi:predicted NBD/HSP70 family sugar kinase
MARLGVDLGGTKIEIAGLGRDGAVVYRRRIETPVGDYGATVEAIAALVEAAERELGERGTVGIATPGARSLATGHIKNANSTCLNGRPLKEDVEARIRARDPHRERRQLLRAFRGARRSRE